MESFDVLVVGAGFAGAATAFHLARRGVRRILVVEAEEVPGAHASGRNAGLVLQALDDEPIRRVAAASVAAYRERPEELGFRACGSLLLGGREELAARRDPDRVPSRLLDAGAVRRLVPRLAATEIAAGLLTPGDGVMDVHLLLRHYLEAARGAGGEVRLGSELLAVRGKGPFRVRLSDGEVEAAALVIAAGAWAGRVAALAGATPLPLTSTRRHLFVLEGVTVDPAEPFVWSLQPPWYFRPESAGLLFCLCDAEPAPGLAPAVAAGIGERLADRIGRDIPSLADARLRATWACLRTHAPDGRFVIGADPSSPALHWVAALGGHGMGCSWEIGRLGAASVLGEAPDPAFDPARL